MQCESPSHLANPEFSGRFGVFWKIQFTPFFPMASPAAAAASAKRAHTASEKKAHTAARKTLTNHTEKSRKLEQVQRDFRDRLQQLRTDIVLQRGELQDALRARATAPPASTAMDTGPDEVQRQLVQCNVADALLAGALVSVLQQSCSRTVPAYESLSELLTELVGLLCFCYWGWG